MGINHFGNIDSAIMATFNEHDLDLDSIPAIVETLYEGKDFDWIPTHFLATDIDGRTVVIKPNIRKSLEEIEPQYPFRIQLMHHILLCMTKIIQFESKKEHFQGPLAQYRNQIISFGSQFKYYNRAKALLVLDMMSEKEKAELFKIFSETRYTLKDGSLVIVPDMLKYDLNLLAIVDHLDEGAPFSKKDAEIKSRTPRLH